MSKVKAKGYAQPTAASKKKGNRNEPVVTRSQSAGAGNPYQVLEPEPRSFSDPIVGEGISQQMAQGRFEDSSFQPGTTYGLSNQPPGTYLPFNTANPYTPSMAQAPLVSSSAQRALDQWDDGQVEGGVSAAAQEQTFDSPENQEDVETLYRRMSNLSPIGQGTKLQQSSSVQQEMAPVMSTEEKLLKMMKSVLQRIEDLEDLQSTKSRSGKGSPKAKTALPSAAAPVQRQTQPSTGAQSRLPFPSQDVRNYVPTNFGGNANVASTGINVPVAPAVAAPAQAADDPANPYSFASYQAWHKAMYPEGTTGKDPFDTAGLGQKGLRSGTGNQPLTANAGGGGPPDDDDGSDNGSGGPPKGPRRPLGPDRPPSRNRRPPSPPRRRSETRDTENTYRSSKLRLKAADIGYWDPHGTAKDDDKFKPERLSVNLFIRRLERLARRFSEEEVCDNLYGALVHIGDWIETLAEEDEYYLDNLEGWIYLLRRDFSEPEVIVRAQAQAYSCADAKNANEFWTTKVSMLRQGGYKDEKDIYYEIWNALPRNWKENIEMRGSLESLRSELKRREAARGSWPSGKQRSNSNSTTDSGYSSYDRGSSTRNGSNDRKRGGSVGSRFDRNDKKSRKTYDSKNPSTACRICEEMGKPNKMHWHRDCPNREEQRKHVSKLNAILEGSQSDDDHSSDNHVPKQSDSGDSESSGSNDKSDNDVSTKTISRIHTNDVIHRVQSDLFQPSTFASPQVFQAQLKEGVAYGQGNMFKFHGPVLTYIKTSAKGKAYRICVDSGCGPVIGNRNFILKTFPNHPVLQREGFSTLRIKAGLGQGEYEVLPDYVCCPLLFITTHGNLVQVNAEVHLTNSALDSNILFGTTGIRSNSMLMDFDREVILIKSECGTELKVPMYMTEERICVKDTQVVASEDLVIPAEHEGLVPVDLADLPDRDMWFSGRQWLTKDYYLKSANLMVSNQTKRIMVANFSDKSYTIKKGKRLGEVNDVRVRDTVSRHTLAEEDLRPFQKPKNVHWLED